MLIYFTIHKTCNIGIEYHSVCVENCAAPTQYYGSSCSNICALLNSFCWQISVVGSECGTWFEHSCRHRTCQFRRQAKRIHSRACRSVLELPGPGVVPADGGSYADHFIL
jgi:hypothetical protein